MFQNDDEEQLEENGKSFDPRKIFSDLFAGMTRMQIGILAGLAGFLILLVCIGGFILLRGVGRESVSMAPVQTPTIMSTVTSVVTKAPTTTPTIAVTAAPYEQLVPANWLHFTTPLVEIWLPNNFKLADKKTVNITAGLAKPELLITEIPNKSSAFNMLVSVSWDLMTGDSLDAFLEAKSPNLPYQSQIADRRTVYVNAVEARRLIIEFRLNNVDYDDMVYVFLDGSTVWYVEYVAEIGEFFANKDVFEQSIKTFRPVKY